MHTKFIAQFAVILGAVAGLPLSAQAAPQILGLVATATPVPLNCADGVCGAELSAICLQQHRPAPAPGTAYRPVKDAQLTLVVRNRAGARRTLAVADLVAIESRRLFNAVAVRLPVRVVRQLAADFGPVVEASLAVGPLTSVVPVAVAGDPRPLGDQEIRDYTGPLRYLAESAIDRDPVNLAATRVLNRMINRLPVKRAHGADQIDPLRAQTMSRRTIAAGPAAAGLVNRVLDTCREKLRIELAPHLRACLANQHDILNTNTTHQVWQALRPSG